MDPQKGALDSIGKRPVLKISEEIANEKLAEFTDYFELDDDEGSDDCLMTPKRRKAFINAIRRGRLEFEMDPNGRLFTIQHLKTQGAASVGPLRYKPVNGQSRVAMDGFGDDKHHRKSLAMMASLAGVDQKHMVNLEGVDLSLMELLFVFFAQL